MDIRCWPMDKIMQLPDECFGRRWVVGVGVELTGANSAFDISEFALPDVFVLWEVVMVAIGTFAESAHIALALGDSLPTTETAFDGLEIVLPGIVNAEGELGEVEVLPFAPTYIRSMRMPVTANGRRLILKGVRDVGAVVGVTAVLTISSIPSEVPSWLNSAHLNNL